MPKTTKKKESKPTADDRGFTIYGVTGRIPFPPPSLNVLPSKILNPANPSSDAGEWLPDDAEASDRTALKKNIDRFLDEIYPPFEPQVLTVFSPIAGQGIVKEYYLPALKVLLHYNEAYFSPQRRSEWRDMELTAVCQNENPLQYIDNPDGSIDVLGYNNPPHVGCECGIYGSVNLEEISEWYSRMNTRMYQAMSAGLWSTALLGESTVSQPHAVLCIVEPSPGATVHLCRKGWKASRAFISEIVGDTISVRDAENLLSNAWQREIKLWKGVAAT
jgi:hypothetical protein